MWCSIWYQLLSVLLKPLKHVKCHVEHQRHDGWRRTSAQRLPICLAAVTAERSRLQSLLSVPSDEITERRRDTQTQAGTAPAPVNKTWSERWAQTGLSLVPRQDSLPTCESLLLRDFNLSPDVKSIVMSGSAKVKLFPPLHWLSVSEASFRNVALFEGHKGSVLLLVCHPLSRFSVFYRTQIKSHLKLYYPSFYWLFLKV